jgi:tetratricopeptide (TPR) repeat protein
MEKLFLILVFYLFLNISPCYSQDKSFSLDKETLRKEVVSCYRLGLIYGLNGMHQEAIKYLKKAIRLDPYYSEAYRILGIVYSLKGEYNQAIENLEKAIKIDPHNKDAYRILKVICGLKDAMERLRELSIQEEEYKRLEEKESLKKEYKEIKLTLKRMEEEIEKLKKSKRERELLGEELKKLRKGEYLKEEPLKSISRRTPKKAKEKKGKKSFSEILEEEKEVAFVDEEISFLPEKRIIKKEPIKKKLLLKEKLELTVVDLKGLWKEGKGGLIFHIEGILENTGDSPVFKPRVEAKFFCGENLIGIGTDCPISKIGIGKRVEFRISLPIPKNCQEDLSYQLFVEEEEILLEKKREIDLFMIAGGRKIKMPIIFP